MPYLYDKNQLLTNIFSMIKTYSKKGGGIMIQTKFIDDKVIVKIVTTSYLKNIIENSDISKMQTQDVNLNIINDLMKKHEGGFRAGADVQKGSTIILSFPLKRKIRR